MDELTRFPQETDVTGFSENGEIAVLSPKTALQKGTKKQRSARKKNAPKMPKGWPKDVPIPPTEDELPYSDGEPMESNKHHLQMVLLIQTLEQHYISLGRDDVAVHGNMAIYFSLEQADKQNFRAPDFFVVLGAKERRLRKSWLIWGEGRAPNLVIELLSPKTKRADKGVKKEIYQDVMRVPEYVLHDVDKNVCEGFRLTRTKKNPHLHYEKVISASNDADIVFSSEELGLELVLWEGEFEHYWDVWLRWRNPETGELLPTGREIAREEYKRAEQEKTRAEQEKTRADEATERAQKLAEKLRALGINPDE